MKKPVRWGSKIGKNTWRPFNGPLQSTSRRNAVVVVRQLFNFLKNTGYLIFSPFDQVSPKVPFSRAKVTPSFC